MLITINLLAFALCVAFLTYVTIISVTYLRQAPPPAGEVDTFGWHVVVPCLDEESVVATTIRRLLEDGQFELRTAPCRAPVRHCCRGLERVRRVLFVHQGHRAPR